MSFVAHRAEKTFNEGCITLKTYIIFGKIFVLKKTKGCIKSHSRNQSYNITY